MLGIKSKTRNQLESSTNFGYNIRRHEALSQVDKKEVFDPNVYKLVKNNNFSLGETSTTSNIANKIPPRTGLNALQIGSRGSDWNSDASKDEIVTSQPPKAPKSKYQELKEKTKKIFNVPEKQPQKTKLDNLFVDNSSTSIGSNNYYPSNGSGSLTALNKVAKWSKNSNSLNSISTTSFTNTNGMDHNPEPKMVTKTADVVITNRGGQVTKSVLRKTPSIEEPIEFDSPSTNDLQMFRSKNEPMPTVMENSKNQNYNSTNRMTASRLNLQECLNESDQEAKKQQKNDLISRMFTKEPTNFSIKLSYDQLFKRTNTMTPHNYADLDEMDPNLRLARENTKKNLVSCAYM
jgi:hypothetical protein